LIKYVEVKDWL